MKIREYREKRGMTKSELAQTMGVDLAAVSRWDSGEAMPRASKLPKLADLFGCTIDELYGRTGPPDRRNCSA